MKLIISEQEICEAIVSWLANTKNIRADVKDVEVFPDENGSSVSEVQLP